MASGRRPGHRRHGETQIEVGCREVRVDPQGGPILRDRIVEPSGRMRECEPQVHAIVGGIGFQAHRRGKFSDSFGFPPGRHEDHAQIVVQERAARVARHGVAEEGFVVPIVRALPPGGEAKRRQQKDRQRDGPKSSAPGQSRDECRHGHNDREGGQVLKVIRHVGIAERVHLQEAEHRKESAAENQQGGQGSAAPAKEKNEANYERRKKPIGKRNCHHTAGSSFQRG